MFLYILSLRGCEQPFSLCEEGLFSFMEVMGAMGMMGGMGVMSKKRRKCCLIVWL